MTLNKWTVALAALGVVSFASAVNAEEKASAVMTALSATTISGYVDNRDTSTNNVYVLDNALKATGALEDVAPGESIYAVRFMGKRAYLVTFLHVDPLFVIDLSKPE